MAYLIPQAADQALACDRLPLASYREIAAHLNLVPGVSVQLLPQTSQEFDYLQSQVGGLGLTIDPVMGDRARERVEQILGYYAERFGPWRSLPLPEPAEALSNDRLL
jgi:hypothetical protein